MSHTKSAIIWGTPTLVLIVFVSVLMFQGRILNFSEKFRGEARLAAKQKQFSLHQITFKQASQTSEVITDQKTDLCGKTTTLTQTISSCNDIEADKHTRLNVNLYYLKDEPVGSTEGMERPTHYYQVTRNTFTRFNQEFGIAPISTAQHGNPAPSDHSTVPSGSTEKAVYLIIDDNPVIPLLPDKIKSKTPQQTKKHKPVPITNYLIG